METNIITIVQNCNEVLLWNIKVLLWLFGALCACLGAILFFRV